MRKRIFALLLSLVMLLSLLPSAFAEEVDAAAQDEALEAEIEEELLLPAEEAEEEAAEEAEEAEDILLVEVDAEDPVDAEPVIEDAEPANVIAVAEAEEETAPIYAEDDGTHETIGGIYDPSLITDGSDGAMFLSPDETVYYPGNNGWTALMVADGKYYRAPFWDNNANDLHYYVTSAYSDNSKVVMVYVENGTCYAKANRAGQATLTIKSSTATCVMKVRAQFRDVKDTTAFFYQPVYWAFDKGITTGTSDLTFSPYAGCTRGQVVTFLYRAAGSPGTYNSSSNPFKDVKKGSYCYNAVLWAYYKGITTGVKPDAFCPDNVCTREQVVTFLWRAAGEPYASYSGQFYDVPYGKYYTTAVAWALKNNITTGVTSSKFGTGASCTRGQIVTFIYRYVN